MLMEFREEMTVEAYEAILFTEIESAHYWLTVAFLHHIPIRNPAYLGTLHLPLHF